MRGHWTRKNSYDNGSDRMKYGTKFFRTRVKSSRYKALTKFIV